MWNQMLFIAVYCTCLVEGQYSHEYISVLLNLNLCDLSFALPDRDKTVNVMLCYSFIFLVQNIFYDKISFGD